MRLRAAGLSLGMAGLAALLVSAGCASPGGVVTGGAVSGQAAAGPAAGPAAPPAELARFYGQQLEWGSCAGYPVGGDLGAEAGSGAFQCSRLSVPLDYANPAGATAQIAVIKSRGRAGADKSLVVNPGGPGVAGLEWAMGSAAEVASGPLGAEFDVVSFDPRGVGASTPRVECLGDAEMDAVRAQDPFWADPEGIAAAERQDQTLIDACVARTGIDVLAQVGTRNAARDLDILRAALGDRQLNYLGFSYGTLLGTVYAQEFPGRVRAMVLDGAVDPGEDYRAELLNQGAGFQGAFDEFARDCAQISGCPLGADPEQAVARYRQLVDGLRGAPASATDPRGLSQSDALTGTVQALYSTGLWGALRTGLGELADGRGDTLLWLADLYEGRDEDGRYQSNVSAAFTAIRCVDTRPGLTAAERGALDTEYRAAAPFLDDGHGSGATAPDVCDIWPVPPTLDWRPEVPPLPQMVVISTLQDSATPYQAGVELAKLLDAALITVEGSTHTAAFGNGCVDEAVNAYLLNPAAAVDDLTCPG